MKNSIIRFIRDEQGVTAIEYGIIAGVMATILVAVFGTFRTDLEALFARIGTALNPPA